MPVLITVPELAEQMHKDAAALYALSKRERDPLPVRYLEGSSRYGAVLVSEFEEWFKRNGRLPNEKE